MINAPTQNQDILAPEAYNAVINHISARIHQHPEEIFALPFEQLTLRGRRSPTAAVTSILWHIADMVCKKSDLEPLLRLHAHRLTMDDLRICGTGNSLISRIAQHGLLEPILTQSNDNIELMDGFVLCS